MPRFMRKVRIAPPRPRPNFRPKSTDTKANEPFHNPPMPLIGKSGRICTSANRDYRSLSAPSTPDVRCGPDIKQNIAARRLVAKGQIATEDKMIPPPAQRQMATRAGATVAEAAGSHAIYVSKPEVVAALIAKAAKSMSSQMAAA